MTFSSSWCANVESSGERAMSVSSFSSCDRARPLVSVPDVHWPLTVGVNVN